MEQLFYQEDNLQYFNSLQCCRQQNPALMEQLFYQEDNVQYFNILQCCGQQNSALMEQLFYQEDNLQYFNILPYCRQQNSALMEHRAPAAQRQMRKKISFGPTSFHLAQTFGAYFFRWHFYFFLCYKRYELQNPALMEQLFYQEDNVQYFNILQCCGQQNSALMEQLFYQEDNLQYFNILPYCRQQNSALMEHRAPAAQRQMCKKISFGPTSFHLAQTFGAYFFRWHFYFFLCYKRYELRKRLMTRINNDDGVHFLIGGDRWWLSVIRWDQLSTLILLIGHGVYLINQECNYIIELADCQ